jgi:hypothetical protein
MKILKRCSKFKYIRLHAQLHGYVLPETCVADGGDGRASYNVQMDHQPTIGGPEVVGETGV